MTLKLVAVLGMTVVVDQTTVVPPGFPVVASILVAPPTGTKNLSESKLDHRHGDTITVTAITVPTAGATIPDPGPYVVAMQATATKTKAEGIAVLRQDDQSALISAVPQIPGSPPTNYPVTFKCKVVVAGQVKVKAQ